MDKYEFVLDIVEHPEKYTSKQLAEIMSDPETGEIYNLLCKVDSAMDADKKVDVEAEWERFSEQHSVRSRHLRFWLCSRAASVAAITGTSVAAITGTSVVALAAGIAVSVSLIGHKPEPVAGNVTEVSSVEYVSADPIAADSDAVNVGRGPIMFEDEPLETIMRDVADAYGVEVKFNSKKAASLHLYYKLDLSLPLNEVVEQLNTFEQINIKQDGGLLTID